MTDKILEFLKADEKRGRGMRGGVELSWEVMPPHRDDYDGIFYEVSTNSAFPSTVCETEYPDNAHFIALSSTIAQPIRDLIACAREMREALEFCRKELNQEDNGYLYGFGCGDLSSSFEDMKYPESKMLWKIREAERAAEKFNALWKEADPAGSDLVEFVKLNEE